MQKPAKARENTNDERPDFIDARSSQGLIYKPTGSVTQEFVTILESDTAYDVHGLPNPYLGLRSYTYSERAIYAGRESLIQEACTYLTNPASPQCMLIVTGDSGSGKSSFVQAGLIPALEEHYRARHRRVRWAVFRPSANPIAMLDDALAQLGFPSSTTTKLDRLTPSEWANYLEHNTSIDQVNLVVIDQLEELFIYASSDMRSRFICLFSDLPSFDRIRSHFIATLRSDYLNELFDAKCLWDLARHGIELRAMNLEQLMVAIQRPLQEAARCDERYRHKRFEPALVEKLAEDASHDATYLPLLQVSLEEIWKKQTLKLEKYEGLATALQKRADTVYQFRDFDASYPQDERSKTEKAEIIRILLDLVSVSMDDNPDRDVRISRNCQEILSAGSQRSELIADLVRARILSTHSQQIGEQKVERVDIIHETLLKNWSRLKEAVFSQRQVLKGRARFEQLLADWKEQRESPAYLLSGIHLAAACQLNSANDIALQDEFAHRFLAESLQLAHSRARRDLLWRNLPAGSIAGAIGFSLAYIIIGLFQTVGELSSLILTGMIIMSVYGMLTIGLITSLGVTISLILSLESAPRWVWLPSLLGGALGFIAALISLSILSNTQGAGQLWLVLAESLLWGSVCGMGLFWGLRSIRPMWIKLPALMLAGGLVFTIGENLGKAFLRDDLYANPALWQVFLAGALVPACLFIALSLVSSRAVEYASDGSFPGT